MKSLISRTVLVATLAIAFVGSASAGPVLPSGYTDTLVAALPGPAGTALQNIPALAVSLEPAGGSPTGLPTGPVLYSGPLQKLY